MVSPARAILRIALYLIFTACLMPVQVVALGVSRPAATRIPVFYHRWCLRIMGLALSVRGRRSTARPTLFVANHTTYLDITVLAAVIPGSFVAKAEVASWPLFGILAKLQRTVFVERRGARTASQRDEIAARLSRGDNLILFPEGTSADGLRVLPFKSALFSVVETPVEGTPLVVQPVSVSYNRLDGMPLGRGFKPYVAWYGDMALAPHLIEVMGLGTIGVEVIFHEPITVETSDGRKALSQRCQAAVSDGVAKANAGRGDELGPAERRRLRRSLRRPRKRPAKAA